MASGDLPDQTGQSIEACFANARDTLRAAKRVLEDENLPNISFHLTVLEVDPVSWTPDYLSLRSLRWQGNTHPMRRSSAGRW
jgi:hypothetical protein